MHVAVRARQAMVVSGTARRSMSALLDVPTGTLLPMTTARQKLLDDVLAHVAEHGISDMSLRQLAAAIGTSHRMLIYHFGSREGLVAAIVASVEEQQRNVMQELAARLATPADLIRAVWRQVADPELRPFVRLFFEVLAAAVQQRPGTEGFLESLTEPWIVDGQQTAVSFGVDSSPTELRLGVAVIRGLLIDVLATGSDDEASASLERFIDMWERTQQTEQPS